MWSTSAYITSSEPWIIRYTAAIIVAVLRSHAISKPLLSFLASIIHSELPLYVKRVLLIGLHIVVLLVVVAVFGVQAGTSMFSPVVSFRYHTSPITSLEWNPNDSSVLAVSAADDRLTIWDFAVESDDAVTTASSEDDVPAQLLFVHQGQKEIKELHWHSQLPGVIISTAMDTFNIFRTISAWHWST